MSKFLMEKSRIYVRPCSLENEYVCGRRGYRDHKVKNHGDTGNIH